MAVIIAILVLVWLVFFFPIRGAVEFVVYTLITIINFLRSGGLLLRDQKETVFKRKYYYWVFAQ